MSLSALSDEIRRLWRAGWPYLHLETLEEARALRACETARGDVPLSRWTVTLGNGGDPALADPADALADFAAGEGAAMLALFDLHRWLDSPRLVRTMRDLAPVLTGAGRLAVVVAPPFELPPELGDDVATLAVPPPDSGELDAMLTRLGATDAEQRRVLLQAALGLPESSAKRAFKSALATPDGGAERILVEKRRHLRDAFALEALTPTVSLDDVGGLEALKHWLTERAGAFTPEARAFGLPPPRGALLLGVQGCGKSLSAKAVAAHFGLPLMRLDLAAIFGGGVPAEGALRRALSAATRLAPAVLWIDEIEKGFAGADPEAEGSDASAARVLGAFTTWLQEKTEPVFVVATANEVRGLPPELLRRGRFDEIFFVDLPDERARRDILSVHLARRGRDPDAHPLDALAASTEHYSGAELEQVVVAGLYRAFGRSRPLEGDDLLRAATDLVPLYRTYEERVKALRAWAKGRARAAGRGEAVVDLLRGAP